MNAFGFRGVVELHGPEQIAVVGHPDGRHFLFSADLHQLIDFAGAIEQGIVGVVVKVNERGLSHFY
jgi:hypothetical protein